MKAIRIKNWSEDFETPESRKRKGAGRWWACPNSLDGFRISSLLAHEDGLAHYGAWCVMCCVASRSSSRGLLITGRGNDARPHSARTLALIARSSPEVFESLIERLTDPSDIGWCEWIELDNLTETRQAPSDSVTREGKNSDVTENACNSTGQDITGQNREEATSSRGEVLVGSPVKAENFEGSRTYTFSIMGDEFGTFEVDDIEPTAENCKFLTELSAYFNRSEEPPFCFPSEIEIGPAELDQPDPPPKKPPKRAHRPKATSEIMLPPELASIEPILEEYFAYRKSVLRKQWTLETWNRNLAKWAGWGPEATEAAVREAIDNEWQGVFARDRKKVRISRNGNQASALAHLPGGKPRF